MKAVALSKEDNVGVALKRLERGEKVKIGGSEIELRDTIPTGHKFTLKEIGKNAKILKWGEVIGRASKKIRKGEWVHQHNLKSEYGS